MSKPKPESAPVRTSSLEEVAPVIGYRATRMLAAWYAGKQLSIPSRATAGHPIADLIGHSAFAALVREFPGERICLPSERTDLAFYTMRRVAERLAQEWTPQCVADDLGITVRRVNQIRVSLVSLGWLKYAQGFQARRAQKSPPEILGTGEGFGNSPGACEAPAAAAAARGLAGPDAAQQARVA